MGREADCMCEWNGAFAPVKALLEPPELILRGGLRTRIPFAEMKQLAADGERLCFRFNKDKICLVLGKETAAKWAKALLTPPPSLAKKLGIAPAARGTNHWQDR